MYKTEKRGGLNDVAQREMESADEVEGGRGEEGDDYSPVSVSLFNEVFFDFLFWSHQAGA